MSRRNFEMVQPVCSHVCTATCKPPRESDRARPPSHKCARTRRAHSWSLCNSWIHLPGHLTDLLIDHLIDHLPDRPPHSRCSPAPAPVAGRPASATAPFAAVSSLEIAAAPTVPSFAASASAAVGPASAAEPPASAAAAATTLAAGRVAKMSCSPLPGAAAPPTAAEIALATAAASVASDATAAATARTASLTHPPRAHVLAPRPLQCNNTPDKSRQA
mmetsp:Transcript_91737/g.231464  ORF Transcript_91737/g.231464 Transcript_91737/m.231464 type:complete len:218 (-) Transcript_91737:583-1236(-)